MLIAIKGNNMSIYQKIQDLEIDTQDIWKDDILKRKELDNKYRIGAQEIIPYLISCPGTLKCCVSS